LTLDIIIRIINLIVLNMADPKSFEMQQYYDDELKKVNFLAHTNHGPYTDLRLLKLIDKNILNSTEYKQWLQKHKEEIIAKNEKTLQDFETEHSINVDEFKKQKLLDNWYDLAKKDLIFAKWCYLSNVERSIPRQ
jgi:hypothetical protein